MVSPSLPEDLHELKRPALLTLCKIWNVKAVGKNTDLIYRLQAAAANPENDSTTSDASDASDEEQEEDDSNDTPQTSTTDVMDYQQSEQDEKSSNIDDAPSLLTRSAPFKTFQSLPTSSPSTSPSHSSSPKRQREESPPPPPAQHLKGRATTIAPMDAMKRKLAPLPRKSVLPDIKMAIQTSQAQSSPLASGSLYPVLPSPMSSPGSNSAATAATPQSVPQFTFTCAASPSSSPARQGRVPFPSAAAASTPFPTVASTTDTPSMLSATTSVLAQLNARLAASGHTSATSTSTTPNRSPLLPHSPSASSLLRNKPSLPTSASHQRFETSHQNQWKKDAGIGDHWSVKRYRSVGNLKQAASATDGNDQQQPVTKKVRREQPTTEATSASASATPVPRPTPAMAQPRSLNLLKQANRKSRSSLSSNRIGRKSVVSGKNDENARHHGGSSNSGTLARMAAKTRRSSFGLKKKVLSINRDSGNISTKMGSEPESSAPQKSSIPQARPRVMSIAQQPESAVTRPRVISTAQRPDALAAGSGSGSGSGPQQSMMPRPRAVSIAQRTDNAVMQRQRVTSTAQRPPESIAPRQRTTSVAQRPAATATGPMSTSNTTPTKNSPTKSSPTAAAPARRFFAFGATTMKKSSASSISPNKTSSSSAGSNSPSKTSSSSTPALSGNALRVAQARKLAAEESRRKLQIRVAKRQAQAT